MDSQRTIAGVITGVIVLCTHEWGVTKFNEVIFLFFSSQAVGFTFNVRGGPGVPDRRIKVQ